MWQLDKMVEDGRLQPPPLSSCGTSAKEGVACAKVPKVHVFFVKVAALLRPGC